MRLNLFLTVVGVIISALLGFLLFNAVEGKPYEAFCWAFSGVCFATTLVPFLAIKSHDEKMLINCRMMSLAFFLLFMLTQFGCFMLRFKLSLYIVLNGLLLLIYLGLFCRTAIYSKEA